MEELVRYGNSDPDINQTVTALNNNSRLHKYNRKATPKFRSFRLSIDREDLTSNGSIDNNVRTQNETSSLKVTESLQPNTSSKMPGKQKTGPDVTYRVGFSKDIDTFGHVSGPDDNDVVGELYTWGDIMCDNVVEVEANKNVHYSSTRIDVLLPKPLTSDKVLDVRHVACGVRHAALVTKRGEVFTWGEESGGRLGHGIGKDNIYPRAVDFLVKESVDFVACGEFHTCAVTTSGELYTWGDGTHNAGLLGHGTSISHWMPKRISGPLEGLRIGSVSCGPWHTALITSTGQLFTFGDGTFGVLGHGNKESVSYPRKIESLSGLRTISVACGVWHTAAVVEVTITQCRSTVSSGKLFTWGDGDKNRLGHGDKDPRLKPTCVSSLIDYDFHKVVCGHVITIGVTTEKRVVTIGSAIFGQLGNPNANGKLPCLVEDKLADELVEDVACGAYHVAVLTSRNEVYTWGKGANGRLGHGDSNDKYSPTRVEALRNKHVKYIACGASYSVAICELDVVEQSHCRKPRYTQKNVTPRVSNKDRLEKFGFKLSKSTVPDFIKHLDNATNKLQLKDVSFSNVVDMLRVVPKPIIGSSQVSSRSVSPFSQRNSSPRSVHTTSSRISLKGANKVLSDEVVKLRAQVESLKQICEVQEMELRKSAKKVEEAIATAADESSKSKAAKDDVNSLTAQLKDMSDRLRSYDEHSTRHPYVSNGLMPNGERHSTGSFLASPIGFAYKGSWGVAGSHKDTPRMRLQNGNGWIRKTSNVVADGKEVWPYYNEVTKSVNGNQVEEDWIEEYETGVYITLVSLQDGTTDLKRVRFSRRKFGEQRAESWWAENRRSVYERYNICGSDEL